MLGPAFAMEPCKRPVSAGVETNRDLIRYVISLEHAFEDCAAAHDLLREHVARVAGSSIASMDDPDVGGDDE